MIKFSIPDYYGFYGLNLFLIDLMKEQPDKFYDDIVIDSVYGSFPCIWNGGRYYPGGTSFENIKATIEPFNERGISIRHTFTNCLLEEKHLNDTLCNKICALTENPLNGVNVNSQLMKDYIEKNYPQFYTMWSTTICEEDIDKINKLSKNNLLVLDYNLNNNFELLKQLKYPHNIEILVCESCISNCPNRKEHYIHESNCQLYNETSLYDCPWALRNFYHGSCLRPHHVDINNIRQNYLPLGIDKFKIMGRGRSAIEAVENYINYFVRPEYKDEIRNELLMYIMDNNN